MARIMTHRTIFINSCVCNTTTKWLYSDGGSDCTNEHLLTRFYSGSSVMSPNYPSSPSPLLLWPFGSSDKWLLMSHKPVATQGYNSDGHSVISPRPVATKGLVREVCHWKLDDILPWEYVHIYIYGQTLKTLEEGDAIGGGLTTRGNGAGKP
jgi:hypothetical protein